MTSSFDVEPLLLLKLLTHHIGFLGWTATLFVVLSTCVYVSNVRFPLRSGGQKLAPGVTVVGGNDKRSISASRERFRENAKEMLEEGYRMVRCITKTVRARPLSDHFQTGGDFFYVPSPLGERLMIPTKYLDELKTAPVDHVDFVATFIEVLTFLLLLELLSTDCHRCSRANTPLWAVVRHCTLG